MNLKSLFRGTQEIAPESCRVRISPPTAAAPILLLLVFLLLPQAALAQTKEVRRVLIFNDLSTLASPGIALMDRAIHERLQESPYQIELYNESLETTLFSDEASQRQMRDWYIRKYEQRQPDVIIAVGAASLKFMIESHEKYFPHIPIIFCGGTEEMLGESKLDQHFTGAWGVADPEKTLTLALRLQPGTQHVVVVGGVGSFDRDLLSIARKSFSKYESNLEFTYLTDLAMPALLERLRHLPGNSIVFHTSIMQDASGGRFIDATQSIPLVAAAANAPVFAVDDVDVGTGAVGGHVLSWAAQGREAAGMALRMLNGESPQNIPVVKTPNVNLFDWRALQRWQLSEDDLPPNSTLINRQSTIWESYKWYMIGGLSLILLEALLIFEMVWLRAKQKKMGTALAITNDSLRLALEGGGSVGWDWDIKTGRNRWFGDLPTMFGIAADRCEGPLEDFHQRIYPEDREIAAKAVAHARQSRQPYTAEFRVVRADGILRWITARGKFYYSGGGEAIRMLGMAVDITERKQAEDALSMVSRRLIQAQEAERARLARELHDDIAQRLAALTINLELLRKSPQSSPAEFGQAIGQATQRASHLCRDLQALSHRLHSSKLEYFGLEEAATGFCRELADQQKVEIDIQSENIPGELSPDIALCIFRVLQESLLNALKHSGSQHFRVSLRGESNELLLSVRDAGTGFDVSEALRGRGLGLTSMKERMKLVAGELTIDSQPGNGTTIHARVPLVSELIAARSIN